LCRTLVLLFGLTLGLTLGLRSDVAHAATFSVTNSSNSGAGSLRQAISDANTAAGSSHTVVFTSSFPLNGTVTLQSSLPVIVANDLEIFGNGRNPRISGADSFAILRAASSVSSLELQDLRLANGRSNTGGCIFRGDQNSSGSLIVRRSTFDGCSAVDPLNPRGGAITWRSNSGGLLLIEASSFTDNRAQSTGPGDQQPGGGAIESYVLTVIRDSSFVGNSVQTSNSDGGFGGALYLSLENVGIFNSVLTGNRFQFNSVTPIADSFAQGGAVFAFFRDGAALQVAGNYFRGNSARAGGAISTSANSLTSGTLTVQNNTFYNNSVVNSGGAAHLTNLRLVADHNTFFNNDGGSSGHLYLRNVTVERMVHQAFAPTFVGPPCELVNVVTSGAYLRGNQFAAACGALSASGAVVTGQFAVAQIDDSDQRIGVIRFAPGAAPIDGGTSTPSDCLAEDARGASRPLDGDGNGSSICDVGAFEHPNDQIFRNGFE